LYTIKKWRNEYNTQQIIWPKHFSQMNETKYIVKTKKGAVGGTHLVSKTCLDYYVIFTIRSSHKTIMVQHALCLLGLKWNQKQIRGKKALRSWLNTWKTTETQKVLSSESCFGALFKWWDLKAARSRSQCSQPCLKTTKGKDDVTVQKRKNQIWWET